MARFPRIELIATPITGDVTGGLIISNSLIGLRDRNNKLRPPATPICNFPTAPNNPSLLSSYLVFSCRNLSVIWIGRSREVLVINKSFIKWLSNSKILYLIRLLTEYSINSFLLTLSSLLLVHDANLAQPCIESKLWPVVNQYEYSLLPSQPLLCLKVEECWMTLARVRRQRLGSRFEDRWR